MTRLMGNRTFTLASSALLGGFVLAVMGKLTGDFATIASIAVGAYSAKSAWTTGQGGSVNKAAEA